MGLRRGLWCWLRVVLCLVCCLTDLELEEICGRSGSFRWIDLAYIGSLALPFGGAMMGVSASLFCGFCSLWGHEHRTERRGQVKL